MLIMNGNIVNMEPAKRLFIEILTKDIKLEKAILDLIDNSIDAAKKLSKNLETFNIRLTLDNKIFKIEDDCGGITVEEAKKDAFRFGSENSDEKASQDSVGHYHIGMKRAFFKIGNIIKVDSATNKDFFSLTINANKWRKSPEWSIKLKNFGTNSKLNSIGTKINIKELNEEAKNKFNNEKFINGLREEIAQTYKDVIRKGITIIVNGYVILTSRSANETELVRYKVDNEKYIAEIILKKDIPNYQKSGWNIYLNERRVVASDKTDLTGWDIGSEEQYHVIRGYVYAKAKRTGALPFTTTKEGLDTSNPTYVELKSLMAKALDESLTKLSNGDFATISYKRPRKDVESLKKVFKVRYYKNVGEKTYDEYIKQNNIEL